MAVRAEALSAGALAMILVCASAAQTPAAKAPARTPAKTPSTTPAKQGQAAQSLATKQSVIRKLGEAADKFEGNAYRFVGREKLTQRFYAGRRLRWGKPPEGVTPGMKTREIVSEYGFVSIDAPGGSLREVRRVISVGGKPVKSGKRGLEALAKGATAMSEKDHRKLLEEFESHGLKGVATDFGQLILLFARGGAERFEISYARIEMLGSVAALVYWYRQIDGPESLTIYAEGKPIRQTLRGEIWVDAFEHTPLRITLDSVREDGKVKIRDISYVDYMKSKFGFLLPKRVIHSQYADGNLT
ncbi:MAG: hypothetical protein ACRD7E_16705, partial [Bryobacteraceae bacterium]